MVRSYDLPVRYPENYASLVALRAAPPEASNLQRPLITIETIAQQASSRATSPDTPFSNTAKYALGLCTISSEHLIEPEAAALLTNATAATLERDLTATNLFDAPPHIANRFMLESLAHAHNAARAAVREAGVSNVQVMSTATKLFRDPDPDIGLYAVVGNVGDNHSYYYHDGKVHPPTAGVHVSDMSAQRFPIKPGGIIVHTTSRPSADISADSIARTLQGFAAHRNLAISARALLWSVDSRQSGASPWPVYKNDVAIGLLQVNDVVPAYA